MGPRWRILGAVAVLLLAACEAAPARRQREARAMVLIEHDIEELIVEGGRYLQGTQKSSKATEALAGIERKVAAQVAALRALPVHAEDAQLQRYRDLRASEIEDSLAEQSRVRRFLATGASFPDLQGIRERLARTRVELKSLGVPAELTAARMARGAGGRGEVQSASGSHGRPRLRSGRGPGSGAGSGARSAAGSGGGSGKGSGAGSGRASGDGAAPSDAVR